MDYLYTRHSHSHSHEEPELDDGHGHSHAAHFCETGNQYNGKTGLRILSIFIILISSGIGSFLPVLCSKNSFVRVPKWCFFVAKYFGSGVVVATAIIHLLAHASHALTEECLGGTFEEYPWAFGICLMAIFALFLVEILSHYYMNQLSAGSSSGDDATGCVEDQTDINDDTAASQTKKACLSNTESGLDSDASSLRPNSRSLRNQLVSVFILEAGIIFHSVFVGLSLAVAGDEFVILFIVLVFHQMFEGLGLGTRIAEIDWPVGKRFVPWVLAFLYAITTPIAIAIGLGVRHSFSAGSRSALIANGVFDSISAGILLYASLVELMAFDFIYSNNFTKEKSPIKILLAFVIMATGAGLMALLGKWA